ncbi:transmembrane and ubiquitin-like domain-containing protein 1 [Diachasma alloeum]|uniref:transmembrane and ubiquitin-like domain-containing protein 1 n=1 Tax=Diachasma alloeum TaxID=454923 RepID=UPI0007383D22|nr:transmembrane and ubiquitin-like domain-containing protein 1 [Diachasma alloeum]XP_015113213.1 transmembrane and ubiquitin-like domain-containing protein 1 [Diachasma alloeum]
MTLIEGVGDEVTDFFIVVAVMVVGWLAWCSTNISEQPLIRTVLILQHRTRTRIAELRANHSTVISDNFTTRASSFDESTANEETAEPISQSHGEAEQTCLLENQNVPQTSETSTPAATGGAASEEVLIQAMDSGTEESESSDDKLESAEKPETNITETATSVSCSPTEASVDSIDGALLHEGEEIVIKLKFINDDQRIVSGRPKEMLGDFKKRHFQAELDSQKRVRLVFNGHVLQPDTDTLEQCGLYNNCAVHCLVHQQRANSGNTNTHSSNADSSSSIYSNPQSFQNMPTGAGTSVHNEWDLSRLLVGLITLVLIIAWYSRYYYAQLFTAAATIALYVLTAVFTLSVVGHFFPDQDSLRNIE